MLPLYRVVLEKGDIYHVYAKDNKEAYEVAKQVYPEIEGKDLRSIEEFKPVS